MNGSAVSVGSLVTIRVTVGSGELTITGAGVEVFRKDKSNGIAEHPVRIKVNNRMNSFFMRASKD
jgi:hypothetical protein